MPNFSTDDIEAIIKKHIRENNIMYYYFDYIHSSEKILTEIGGKSGVKNLREDNILFLMSSRLKDITTQYGVWIMSSTQLNADYQTSETPDQNLLRGSKAIADRIDWGSIMLDVKKEDIEKISDFCKKNGLQIPNVKISIYKNRGKWKGIYLWVVADRSMCRFDTIFVTDWAYNVVDMQLLKIKVNEESAF
jgi:replicative DNA helicase